MSITMSSARDPTARLRAGLNPLLTASLGVYHPNQTSTPLSAVSMASGSHTGSLNAFSSAQTPVSAIQPYNPQQWIASPIPGHPERAAQHYEQPQRKSPGRVMTEADRGSYISQQHHHLHRPRTHRLGVNVPRVCPLIHIRLPISPPQELLLRP